MVLDRCEAIWRIFVAFCSVRRGSWERQRDFAARCPVEADKLSWFRCVTQGQLVLRGNSKLYGPRENKHEYLRRKTRELHDSVWCRNIIFGSERGLHTTYRSWRYCCRNANH